MSSLKIFSSVVIEFLSWHDAGYMTIIPLNEHYDNLIDHIEQQVLAKKNIPNDLPIFCYSEFNEVLSVLSNIFATFLCKR